MTHAYVTSEEVPTVDGPLGPSMPLNPAELKIELLCRGIRMDESCRLSEEGRPLVRTRAGLGSGLEITLPGPQKDVWVNVPVVEEFARQSPYHIRRTEIRYEIIDERTHFRYPVEIASRPAWYDRTTSRGIPMTRVATLQGTCLSVYVGSRCRFWSGHTPLNCKFCTTGLNVGVAEEEEKTVDDVVETALAARAESRVTFIHFNGGYQSPGALQNVFPYVEAVKRRAGLLVGLQFPPEEELSLYDRAIALGADHFSFCFEFYNSAYFSQLLPGKAKTLGRDLFFRSMEYSARKLGRGRVSGEIIAGVEPIEDTLDAIEYIVRVGAFPMVCIFRPLVGAEMENCLPPDYPDMVRVFRRVYETCRKHNLPLGIAPNIHVSLSLQPEDTLYFSTDSFADWRYRIWLKTLKRMLKPYFAYRMRPTG